MQSVSNLLFVFLQLFSAVGRFGVWEWGADTRWVYDMCGSLTFPFYLLMWSSRAWFFSFLKTNLVVVLPAPAQTSTKPRHSPVPVQHLAPVASFLPPLALSLRSAIGYQSAGCHRWHEGQPGLMWIPILGWKFPSCVRSLSSSKRPRSLAAFCNHISKKLRTMSLEHSKDQRVKGSIF